MLKSASESRVR